MKILIINSRYFPSAGPEKYLFNITAALEDRGHEIIPFSLKNSKNLPTPYAEYFADNIGGGDELYFEEMDSSVSTRLQLVARQFHSVHVKNKLKTLIEDTKPDIAYILHYQNRLSPSVITACKECNIPIVLRISDFSLLCIGNHLLRDGSVCELCITGGLHNGVRYKCAKASIVASAIKAAALKFHRWRKTFLDVDRVVVPSLFTMSRLESFLQKEKMIHLATLVPHHEIEMQAGEYALFVGRVEEEKGLKYAIKAFEGTNFRLKIVGFSHSGYGSRLQKYVDERPMDNVVFLGPKFGEELSELYRNCRFLIAPGICYENLPNVVLEAMAYGKPVAASEIGSISEVVIPDETGLLFKAADANACREAVEKLFDSDELCQRFGRGGYQRVMEHYSVEKHYQTLMGIFSDVRNDHPTSDCPGIDDSV